jgi:hypothetical protein
MSEIRELIDADFASRVGEHRNPFRGYSVSPIGLNVATEEDGVVTMMIDLEEIDLSVVGTSARKNRANKKNVAKILARGQSRPSWKRSLASLRGEKTRAKGWLGQKDGIRRDGD